MKQILKYGLGCLFMTAVVSTFFHVMIMMRYPHFLKRFILRRLK